jgi:hypothetical protein
MMFLSLAFLKSYFFHIADGKDKHTCLKKDPSEFLETFLSEKSI